MARLFLVLAAIAAVVLTIAAVASLGHLWVILGITLALHTLGHLEL